MRTIRACLACLALAIGCGLTGCSDAPQQTVIDLPPVQPLTVDEWKTMPVDTKYENDTFERLKLNDPKLNDEAAWNAFMRSVIVPERKQDIPSP